jgi:hypothetical protein
VYVEIDWMAHHRPLRGALKRVVNSYAAAPVSNPDGSSGVRLHLQLDEEACPHRDQMTTMDLGGPTEFDDVKAVKFGTSAERSALNGPVVLAAKRLAYRYALFIHLQAEGGYSGVAEIGGNDLVISLGGFAKLRKHNVGNADQQAGTFMHELGHTLNLRHGGGDDGNTKPNYISVMNYLFQFDHAPVEGRKLDYSVRELLTLDENALSESAGVGDSVDEDTAYYFAGPPGTYLPTAANLPIDWNFDGDTQDSIALDVNGSTDLTVLAGYDDWSNLDYNFRDSPYFGDGARPGSANELTFQQALAQSNDADGDGVLAIADNCPSEANSDQEDSDEDGFGDVCDNCATVYNPVQEDPITCSNTADGGVSPDGGNEDGGADAGAPSSNGLDAGDEGDTDASNPGSGGTDHADASADDGSTMQASDAGAKGDTPAPPPSSGCACAIGTSRASIYGDLAWLFAVPLFLRRLRRRKHAPVRAALELKS